MRGSCPYCGANTVLVKDQRSKRWYRCATGTTSPHRCDHWAGTTPGNQSSEHPAAGS